jgi:ribosomal protein S18 acetylase RimI-like enzyme
LEVRVQFAEAANIDAIVKIARKDANDLGFQPKEAYFLAAGRKEIISAIYKEKYCVGYLEFGGTTKPYWSLYQMAVARIARNQGVGKALINEFQRLAKEAGAGVKLKVTSTNSVAIAFYLRQGFRIVSKSNTANQSMIEMQKEANQL